MSASSARLSPPSSPPARWMVARASTTGSLSWKPIAISCIDSSTTGLSRPTAPKSRNQSMPSGSTKMFPGCGSAWYSPSRSTWSRNDCSSRPASTLAGSGAASIAVVVGHGDAADLLHHQHASRRERLVHLRRRDPVVALEVLEERDAARRLGAVVELALQRGDELLGQPLHAELRAPLRPAARRSRRPCAAPRRRGGRCPRSRAAAPSPRRARRS